MTKILITGATGFIGSWLVRYFTKEGKNIIAHGSSKESLRNLRQILIDEKVNLESIEFWEQNFLKTNWKFPDFSRINTIIHCAAATKVREGTLENYERYYQLNVVSTKNLAKKAIEKNVGHFIHLSTGQVYGIPSSFPITEKTPLNPINLYGFSKLIGEKIIASFGVFGLNYTIMRPFSVFGIGHNNIISIIKERIKSNKQITIYGDGTQSRAFSHVDDICRAIDIVMNREQCFSKEYNLSGEKEYSVNDLVRMISDSFNKEPELIYKESGVNELTRNIADISNLKDLGFKPEGSLEKFILELS
jgi:UDP-glucose 4-epimerase